VPQIEYLGHVISATGVSTNPTKVKSIIEWAIPTSVTQLRSFMGLTGYYRRFVKNYGLICKPHHELLKRMHLIGDLNIL
jgi:hypothetical protein